MSRQREVSVEQHIVDFFYEWVATLKLVGEAIAQKNLSVLKETITLPGLIKGNYVSHKGYGFLKLAARKILEQEKLSIRSSLSTATDCLEKSFSYYVERSKKTGIFSEHGTVKRARRLLRESKRSSGYFIVPIVLSFKEEPLDFQIGNTRLVSHSELEDFLAAPIRRYNETRKDELDDSFRDRWLSHNSLYKHFVVVELHDYEVKSGWRVAREVSDMALNIIRMYFRHQHTDDIRVANGFYWQHEQASAWVSTGGDLSMSLSSGGGFNFLETGWHQQFHRDLLGYSPLIAGSIAWISSGIDANSPIRERLSYANRLIAESYGEPHDPIRLVRMISALEALAVVSGSDKAHSLAYRCACAGGWSETAIACEIYDKVRYAYSVRSSVVHGDAPSIEDVRRAFYGIENHMLRIYLGFLWLITGIYRDIRPQSIAKLRRSVDDRIDLMFWNADLVA